MEKPPTPPSGPKRPRKEKTYKDFSTAVEIPRLPTHEKPLEELTLEELEDMMRAYQKVIDEMMKKNDGSWAFDRAIAEAVNKSAQYNMRRQEILQKDSEKP